VPAIYSWEMARASRSGSPGSSWSDAAPSSDLLQDWVDRSTAAGVVQAIRFTDGTTYFNKPVHIGNDSKSVNVVFNSSGGIIGDGCLRINVPAADAENSGAWRYKMNDSWSTDQQGFGSTDWYAQFRLKLGPNRIVNDNGTDVQGFKICNFGEYVPTNPAISRSHPDGEIVIQQYGELSATPRSYTDNSSAGGSTTSWFETNNFPQSGDIQQQNMVDHGSGAGIDRYCLYDPSALNSMSAGCWRWMEEVWYTIYVHVKLVTANGSTGNVFEMSVAGPSDSSYTPLISYTGWLMSRDTSLPNGLNGIHLLPFKTRRDSGNVDTYHEYDQIIVSTSPIACPSPITIPSWVPASVGTWAQIPNSNLSSVAPSPTPNGAEGPAAKVDDWTGFCLDPRTSVVYCADNGGHNGYAGNEVDKLTLETESPAWSQVRAPTSNANLLDADYYADGRPTSKHTYYGEWFDSRIGTNGKVMIFGGSRWNTGGTTRQVDAFDINSSDYDASATYPDIPAILINFGVQAFAGTQHPSTLDCYFCANNEVHRWTRRTQTWTELNAGVAMKGERAASAVDTSRNRILYVGGMGPDHHTFSLSSNTATSITLTGAQSSSVANSVDMAMWYVPEIDRFLVLKADATAPMYQINAATFEVTTFTTSGGGSIPAHTKGSAYTRCLYVARLKSFVWFPVHGSNGWIVRVRS
jgi:hypothetical protein